VSENEIGIEPARARLGDLANRAYYAGQVTYLTRRGRCVAAIVPLDRIKENHMTATVTAADIVVTLDRSGEDDGWNWADAALEQWVAAAEQAGLRVKTISTDVPDEAYDAGVVEVDGAYLISVRNDEITARPVRAYTLTIVEGIQPGSNGSDLGSPESPVQYAELPDEVTDWLTAHNFDPDHPDIWVLVTPAGEDPRANMIDSRLVVLT